jgi:hypothetical protein
MFYAKNHEDSYLHAKDENLMWYHATVLGRLIDGPSIESTGQAPSIVYMTERYAILFEWWDINQL